MGYESPPDYELEVALAESPPGYGLEVEAAEQRPHTLVFCDHLASCFDCALLDLVQQVVLWAETVAVMVAVVCCDDGWCVPVGLAGTGKSYGIHQYCAWIRQRYRWRFYRAEIVLFFARHHHIYIELNTHTPVTVMYFWIQSCLKEYSVILTTSFLRYESEDINIKNLFQKFQSISNLRLQSYAWLCTLALLHRLLW